MRLEKYAANDSIEDFYAAEPEQIARQIQNSLGESFPLVSQNRTLRLTLSRVWINSKRDAAQVPGKINEFRFEGKSYSMPIMGEFLLEEKKGMGWKQIDRASINIGPYYPIVPNLNTRLISGKLYQNKLQFRRQPGAYPHRNKAGDALIEFNTAAGRSFNVGLDLNGKGRQTIDIRYMGANSGIERRAGYATLRALGKTDEEIKKMWGEDVWEQNALDDKGNPLSEAAITKLVDKSYNRFKDKRDPEAKSESFEEAASRLRNRLEGTKGALDPKVTRQTLGVESDHVNADVLMGATNKLLSIHGGEDPAHRFSERFRSVHSVGTQVAESLSHHSFRTKFVQKVQRSLDRAAVSGKTPRIKGILEGSQQNIRKTIKGAFTNSDLSTTTETSNIADIEARSKEITIQGPGGIRQKHAIQDETVSLHPSRLGLTGMVKTQVSAPGVVVPLAQSAVIDGDEVLRRVFDRHQNKIRTVTSEEIDAGGLAFPDEFTRKGNTFTPKKKRVLAAMGDDVREVPEKEVRYVIVDQSDLFSSSVNSTPFLGHNSGPRVIMGSNQMTQGIALKNPEAPLVRSVAPDGQTFDEKIGRKYNAKAPVGGRVEKVSYDSVVIKGTDGKRHTIPLLRDLPLNQGSFIDQESVVNPGDTVSAGQLLSKNNYTDEAGALAIGRNLHTAYMPMDGWNHEDGIVLSQSGADKLTSVHMKEFTIDINDNDKTGAGNYNTYLGKHGKTISPDNRAKLDNDGLIQVGAVLEPGDVIAAVVSHSGLKDESDFSRALKKLMSNLRQRWRDRSLYWEANHEGEVIKVVKTPTTWRVFVKSEAPFKVGDKLSNRFGAKGIVSKIYADDQMPSVKDKDGNLKPLDMIIDPHGIPSRANPGQVLEIAAGKLAKERGEPYLVKNFEPDALEKLRKEMKRAGIPDKETVIDPETGREIPGIATGYLYNAKLRHQLDKKFNVRDTFNDGYDLDERPLNGAAIDKLTAYALVGHNARANLSEMARLKGTENEAYWADVAAGRRPMKVSKTPFTFEKMKALMQGMGVSVEARDDLLEMTPLTDKDVEKMSNGAITTGRRQNVRVGGLKKEKGGLWDPNLISKDGWNHIELPEPTPNPIFIKPISFLLKGSGLDNVKVRKNGKTQPISGLAQQDIQLIYSGEIDLIIDGEVVKGGNAIKKALSMVDLDSVIESNTEKLKDQIGRGKMNSDKSNEHHVTIRYAKMLREKGIKPDEAYIMTKVPVLPPVFRQPVEDTHGNQMETSADKLYSQMIHDANAVKQFKEWGIDEETEEMKETRKALFQSFGALVGARGTRNTGNFSAVGFLDQLSSPKSTSGDKAFDMPDSKASGPKSSYPQKKVIKKPMELSGRTTIIPDPGLDIDEAGIPEEAAWAMYAPFVRGRLTNSLRGTYKERAGIEAKNRVKDRTPDARQALEAEMKKRPVMLNRAPSWWQYNMMAFKPTLITNDEDDGEKALRIPSLVVAPYMGGDYDGDALNMHVPAEDEAVHEAWSMMPSRHLRTVGSKKIMIVPDQSMLIGLYHLSGWKRPKGTVKEITDYRKAVNANEVRLDEVVRYDGRETTVGWEMMDEAVRGATGSKYGIDDLVESYNKAQKASLNRKTFFFTKPLMKDFLSMLIEDYPDYYGSIVQRLAREGDRQSTRYGVSVGLSDLTPFKKEVDTITKATDKLIPELAKEIAALNSRKAPNQKDTDEALVTLYDSRAPVTVGTKTVASVRSQLENVINGADRSNQLVEMMQVGSKGNIDQIRQVLAAPLIVEDVMQRKVPVPVKNSYAGGLTTSEYFVQQHGALKGLRDRAVETSRPGDIGKQMLSSAAPLIVSEVDCGTPDGEKESTAKNNRNDIIDRVLAQSAGGHMAGTVVDGRVYADLARKVKYVTVRSPMTCEAEEGVCQKCFGLQSNGQFPAIGENIGVQQAQAIVEPLANAKLKSFHTTGASDGGGSLIDRVEEIVNLKKPHGKAILLMEPEAGPDAMFVISRIEENRGSTGVTSKTIHYRPKKGGEDDQVRIPPASRIVVSQGETVRNGDRLTAGPIDPTELQEVRGFRTTQRYLANELRDWIGVNKRTAETVTAAMSRMGRVVDPGGSDYTPADTIPMGHIRAFNRKAEASGKAPIAFSPQIFGMSAIPKQGEDWLPKLDFRNIKDQIIRAGSSGQKSPIHGANPMSAYIFGREMDQGTSGGWRY